METFNEYHKEAVKTGDYPGLMDGEKGNNLIYPALGLAGEAGETVDKIKKLWRNQGVTRGSDVSPEDTMALLRELGDVLWYVTAIANELGVSLATVARLNIEKLQDRQLRGVIKSEGDNR